MKKAPQHAGDRQYWGDSLRGSFPTTVASWAALPRFHFGVTFMLGDTSNKFVTHLQSITYIENQPKIRDQTHFENG